MLPIRPSQRAALRLTINSATRQSSTSQFQLVRGAFTATHPRPSQSQYPSNQTQYSHPSSRPSSQGSVHTNFYKTHGRALFKSLTMAFLSYQVFYWAWLTLETETMKDDKGRQIKELEEEARLLASGQGSHLLEGKRLLDEPVGDKKER